MLSENDVKAELSYAYLHAVAARAGFECVVAGRHKDNAGVDAVVSIKERLDQRSQVTEFSLDFQLKSTSQVLTEAENLISYPLEVSHYNKLRGTTYGNPKFLLLLKLPVTANDWLNVTADQLICQRCIHWVSLFAAPETANTANITVYLPSRNILTPEAIRDIARRISLGEDIEYHV